MIFPPCKLRPNEDREALGVMGKVHGRREGVAASRCTILISLNRLRPTVGLQRRQVCYVDVASESIELKIYVGCSVVRCVKHERRNFVRKTTFATIGVR